MSHLQLSLVTLTELKHAGDKLAERAWYEWINLSRYNDPPVFVDCWYVNERFEIGLTWHSKK